MRALWGVFRGGVPSARGRRILTIQLDRGVRGICVPQGAMGMLVWGCLYIGRGCVSIGVE